MYRKTFSAIIIFIAMAILIGIVHVLFQKVSYGVPLKTLFSSTGHAFDEALLEQMRNLARQHHGKSINYKVIGSKKYPFDPTQNAYYLKNHENFEGEILLQDIGGKLDSFRIYFFVNHTRSKVTVDNKEIERIEGGISKNEYIIYNFSIQNITNNVNHLTIWGFRFLGGCPGKKLNFSYG